MKKRSTVSGPGQPPRSRDPQGRYKRIIYAWDAAEKQTVVGHIGYPSKQGNPPVPSIHEFGKTTRVKRLIIKRKRPAAGLSEKGRRNRNRAYRRLMRTYGPFQDSGRNRQLASGRDRMRSSAQFRTETVRYPSRPVMVPALARAQSRLPDIWASSVQT